jgi:hypothetical protein
VQKTTSAGGSNLAGRGFFALLGLAAMLRIAGILAQPVALQ